MVKVSGRLIEIIDPENETKIIINAANIAYVKEVKNDEGIFRVVFASWDDLWITGNYDEFVKAVDEAINKTEDYS